MVILKRFLAFDFQEYYPAGGWNDFVASYDTIEEARKNDHTQIIDMTNGEEV